MPMPVASGRNAAAAFVERVLQPLPVESDGPCGPDLEYDNDFLELLQAAAGRPETQFTPGLPPDWPAVREKAERLFERTRDLRVALLWCRAGVHLEGLAAAASGLGLLRGLLETFWDAVHPRLDPDDGDPFARLNVLAELSARAGFLGDLRQCVLFDLRGIGELRMRTVEIALGLALPRDDESALSRTQVGQMLRDAVRRDPSFGAVPRCAADELNALCALLDRCVGSEHAVDLTPLRSLLGALAELMPAADDEGDPDSDPEATAGGDAAGDKDDGDFAAAWQALAGRSPVPAADGVIRTRDDAVLAIDAVCEFLERTEPTHPAPLLLRRARRLIDHNFLQLLKEFAPDALPAVAQVMGVDPESVELGGLG